MAYVRLAAVSLSSTRRSPEQILAERFAAGEIDSDEYHQRLDALRSTKAPTR